MCVCLNHCHQLKDDVYGGVLVYLTLSVETFSYKLCMYITL